MEQVTLPDVLFVLPGDQIDLPVPFQEPTGILGQLCKLVIGRFEAGSQASSRGGRASGGKVDRHEELVGRLMRKADEAKRATNKTTEPLLKAPDEAIVRALDVAQQAI